MQTDTLDRPALLVLYFSRGTAQLPLRSAIEDHLFCWRTYSGFPAIFHNYAFGFDWADYADLPICAVILDTLALNIRWQPDFFLRKSACLQGLGRFRGPKLAMPQDEFVFTDVLSDVLAGLGVTHLLSAAKSAMAEMIYRRRLPNVTLGQKLTGYLDDATVARIDRLGAAQGARTIDVGYRAWRAEPWLGQHGQLKVEVAERALDAAADMPGLRIDVSTAPDAVLPGDDWLRFLLRCRATLGAEGGASVLDRDGSIRARTQAYLADATADASFEAVRRACFPDDDGKLDLFCIGPRHLEACATGTCQLLVRGDYQGILRENVDYLPIERDFSNMKEVLGALADDRLVRETAQRARRSVVESGRYSYRRFVAQTEAWLLAGSEPASLTRRNSRTEREAIAAAIARHDDIYAFAKYEAQTLFLDRRAYEHSKRPKWIRERWRAAKLAARTGIHLNPD